MGPAHAVAPNGAWFGQFRRLVILPNRRVQRGRHVGYLRDTVDSERPLRTVDAWLTCDGTAPRRELKPREYHTPSPSQSGQSPRRTAASALKVVSPPT